MICKKCKYWVASYTKIVGKDKYFVGECRIRSSNGNTFPERFDYEGCWEFIEKEIETKPVCGSEVSTKALEFIENTKRPAARALRSEWDEYIDNIKQILQGEQ